MKKKIDNEFMHQIATEQAWKELSSCFAWTEALLEKYADKVDWKDISDNINIIWTIPMLEKYADKLDWKRLSCIVDCEWFTEQHLESCKNRLFWSEVSSNLRFSESIIEKFADYLDWGELINNYNINNRNDNTDFIAFYEKYKEHIPMSKLQDSHLWNKIINQRALQLKAEILS